MENSITIAIFNYNCSENALRWYYRLKDSFPTYIFDSYVYDHYDETYDLLKYMNDDHVFLHPNINLGGLTLKAFKKARENKSEWLLAITSDVMIDDENFSNLERRLLSFAKHEDGNDIGLYEVTATEDSCIMGFLREDGPNYGDVYFIKGDGDYKENGLCEGWLYMARTSITSTVADTIHHNVYGWGIGDIIRKLSKKNGFRNVVDNTVVVHHPQGTGYNADAARAEWKKLRNTVYPKLGITTEFP